MSILRPTSSASDMIDWLAPVNRMHPLADGLVGFWLAVQNQGGWKSNRWLDLTDPVRGNHGTLTNMDPATDWNGAAPSGGFGSLNFDGTNDAVIANTELALADFTFFIRFRKAGSTFNKTIIGASANATPLVQLRTNTSTIGYRTDINVFTTWSLAQAYTIGEWTDMLITRTGDSNRCYVNGVESSTGSRTDSGTFSWDQVGTRGTVAEYFDGDVSVFMVFERGFTAADYLALRRESLTGYPNLLRRDESPVGFVAAAGGGTAIHPFYGPFGGPFRKAV